MGRIFRRGELKEAIVLVLETLGVAHGYAIMGELKERIGGGWRPSPGAIYPALVALVETGHVEAFEQDGTRMYRLTDAGRQAARNARSESRWASLSARAQSGEKRVAVGSLLDRFAAESPLRRRLADTSGQKEIEAILARASAEVEQVLTKGEDDGRIR
jgi:DNA-binding PadR family transcriptional regulator